MANIKEKIKSREIISYLVFGVLTTVVGWTVYFSVLSLWRWAFSIPVQDTQSAVYLIGYSLAQIIQWVVAVLFAFFTNRKWVFTDARRDTSTVIQLAKFAGGRVVTFLLDYGVTLFVALGLAWLLPAITRVEAFGREWNLAEIGSKLLAAVIVIVCNYILSKVFVFKDKKTDE